MKKTMGILLAAALLAACGPTVIEGSWVQPVPSMQAQVQGFTLLKGGHAQSVNMATLLYQSWEVDGERLTLRGESLGNGQTLDFAETYTAKMPDKNTLILIGADGEKQTFTRQK